MNNEIMNFPRQSQNIIVFLYAYKCILDICRIFTNNKYLYRVVYSVAYRNNSDFTYSYFYDLSAVNYRRFL